MWFYIWEWILYPDKYRYISLDRITNDLGQGWKEGSLILIHISQRCARLSLPTCPANQMDVFYVCRSYEDKTLMETMVFFDIAAHYSSWSLYIGRCDLTVLLLLYRYTMVQRCDEPYEVLLYWEKWLNEGIHMKTSMGMTHVHAFKWESFLQIKVLQNDVYM
jgi:hypothetical protein